MGLFAITTALVLTAAPLKPDDQPATTPLKIDPTKSELYVKTTKDGVASAFAHNHVIVATNYSGTLNWDPFHLDRCKLKVTVVVNDLVVDDPTARKKVGGDWSSEVSDGDRKSVRQNMLSDIQLDAKKFPEITLEASSFKCRGSGQCELDGKLTLHGVTRDIHFSAKIKGDATSPTGEGSFKLNTSDYGIKPYSAGLGTIKNKDEIELVFKLSASAAP
jgi:polyisoprenoid-binding protein YceI